LHGLFVKLICAAGRPVHKQRLVYN